MVTAQAAIEPPAASLESNGASLKIHFGVLLARTKPIHGTRGDWLLVLTHGSVKRRTGLEGGGPARRIGTKAATKNAKARFSRLLPTGVGKITLIPLATDANQSARNADQT